MHKTKPKWIEDLNIIPDILNLIERNVGYLLNALTQKELCKREQNSIVIKTTN